MRDVSVPNGTERVRQFFAWLPVTVRGTRRETRRWETVRVREEYSAMYGTWFVVAFLEPEPVPPPPVAGPPPFDSIEPNVIGADGSRRRWWDGQRGGG